MPILIGAGTGAAVLICGVGFSYLSGDWSIFDFAWKLAAVAAPATAISEALSEYAR